MTPEQSTAETATRTGPKSLPTGISSTDDTSNGLISRAWAKLRSWFEVPYGYEDETGFHYGHEPAPIQATTQVNNSPAPFRETFRDSAHGSAMFMAATGGQSAPPPKPEDPKSSEAKDRSRKTELA